MSRSHTWVLGTFFGLSLLSTNVLAQTGPLEPVTVTKVTFDGSGNASLHVNVATGGCTGAGDFRVVVSARGNGQSLRIDRVKQDVCELYAPQGTTIDLPVSGLRRGTTFVENPLFVGR